MRRPRQTVRPARLLVSISIAFFVVVAAAIMPLPAGALPQQSAVLQQAPAGETFLYTVTSGETLGAIAERFGTTAALLQQINGIRSSSSIRMGMRLKIPLREGALWSDPAEHIEVFSPRIGEYYRSPIAVNGFSRTLGGNVYLRLVSFDNEPIAESSARGGTTSYGFFHGYLRFEVTEPTLAYIQIYEAASPGQQPISHVGMLLHLEPGQRSIDLQSPGNGSIMQCGVRATFYSNSFEGNVGLDLTGRGSNLPLWSGFTNAGGGYGFYREATVPFAYTVVEPRAALVGVYTEMPSTGYRLDYTRVPVSLLPQGSVPCAGPVDIHGQTD